jgi:ssDNA-binding Zn-finger/Zn-ribbon topoisomerase 1
MGPDRFTCTKCQLRIWRNFMGYELTPTDLQEMLHGDKVTSTEKTLTRQKDGQEITIRGRLMLNEEYKVRIAPKLKSKTATDQACPKCKTGKLQLITGIDDSKWYGCSGYPQCRFTKSYVPHTFTSALFEVGRGRANSGSKDDGSQDGQESAGGGGQAQSLALKGPNENPLQQTAKGKQEPNRPRAASIAENGAAKVSAEIALDKTGRQPTNEDKHRRIPRFILEMLHLARPPTVPPPGGHSIS